MLISQFAIVQAPGRTIYRPDIAHYGRANSTSQYYSSTFPSTPRRPRARSLGYQNRPGASSEKSGGTQGGERWIPLENV